VVLLPFTAWQTVLPIVGWLAPLFLLRFSRTQRTVIGLPIMVLVSCLAQAFAWRDELFGGPANVMTYGINVTCGLLFGLAYAADRWPSQACGA
jgi:apolipoprotein N-acyltransferase